MYKFLTTALTILVLITAASGQHNPAATNENPAFFPFSVWYSGGKARAPMMTVVTPQSREEWRRDLQQIRELGFNTVRTWVEWAHTEPQPGEYNFENLMLLMELAEEAGLKVFIQMYADSAPDWVGEQNPDGHFVAQSGAIIPSQAAPGFCTDHSGVREAVLRFYTETARVASRYDSFYGWDLWSEPHIINWASIDYVPDAQFCFCPHTMERFRDWLQQKYGSLDELNRAWYRNFTSWSQVEPPRFSTILSYTDFIDWKMFIYRKLQEDMGMRYDAVREGDPANVITAHAVGASLFQSPYLGAGATDDFLMARPLDHYGVSLYPKHNHPDRHWSPTTVRVVMDFIRSANIRKGGWYVGELQAGPGTIGLLQGDPVTPGDHRVWAWSAIAKGAKAVNIYAYYPMSSGYESGGYGLIGLDGTITERARRAGEIAATVSRNMDLFLESQPAPAQVAIVYNPLSQMVGGLQRRDYPGAMTASLIGYYRYFADMNIPVDFIHREDLEAMARAGVYDTGTAGDQSGLNTGPGSEHEPGSGSVPAFGTGPGHVPDLVPGPYKLVIVPWPVMFTQQAADGLKRFTEEGGYVLSEARLAWNDDRGYAAEVIPGMGLSEVFGVRERELRMREGGVDLLITSPDHPAAGGLREGDKLRGSLYAQTFDVLNENSRVLAEWEDGRPVMVESDYGNGHTLIVGSHPGWAAHPDPSPEFFAWMNGVVHRAGIERPFTTSHDGIQQSPVEVRLQEHPAGRLLYVINHGQEPQEVTISLRVAEDGMYSLRDVIEDRRFSLTAHSGRLEITATSNPRDVIILELSAAN
jgi:beta-galactosidase